MGTRNQRNSLQLEEDLPNGAAGSRRGLRRRHEGTAPHEPSARSTPLWGLARRWARAFLGVPLFYKILIANALIVVLGAAAGTAVTARFVRAAPERSTVELVGLFAMAGVVLSVLVNAAILKLALQPLERLRQTAERIQGGDLDARAPVSVLADRGLERLIRLFNAMLDGLASYRQRLRQIAARALNAAEEERKRIARELHDETAQNLAALLVRIRVARATSDPGTRDELLEEIRRQITETLEGIRRYARGLRPPALDELGLIPAIESYARTLSEASGLTIQIDAAPLKGVLSPEAELALYRIVQEALSNVIRHAEATQARIRVERADGRVVAVIEDNGHGFDVAEALNGKHRGLGLFGMRERAAYVGGQVQIESKPGAGTRVSVQIPAV